MSQGLGECCLCEIVISSPLDYTYIHGKHELWRYFVCADSRCIPIVEWMTKGRSEVNRYFHWKAQGQ